MSKATLTAIALAASSFASANPAAALLARTWVASTGTDNASCGPIQTPCRTLQYAHDLTSPSGEVDVQNSAGYGSINITKAIRIIGTGSFAGVLATGTGDAVTITAGPTDLVVLRGLTIEGSGTGHNGVVLNSAGVLDISDCVIQNFAGIATGTGNGILVQPASGSLTVILSNTVMSHNGNVGFSYVPTSNSTASTTFVIDHVFATDNANGIVIYGTSSSGTTVGSLRNATASKNSYSGFSLATGKFDVDLCHADENYLGYQIYNDATATIGRSTGSNNVQWGLETPNGTSLSYGDNRFNGNGTVAVDGTLTPATRY